MSKKMPSKLFIATTPNNYEETSFKDLENKGFWCSITENKERAFVAITKQINNFPWNIEIHPEKTNNPYHPDLLCILESGNLTGEVKIKNSPLFFASKDYGIDPQYALTMDLKDSFNYTKWLERDVDIQIFIWVKWEAHQMQTWGTDPQFKKFYTVQPMKGIWTTKFSKLLAYEKNYKPPIHWYKNRKSQLIDINTNEAQHLLKFEPRLQENNKVRTIAENGFIERDGIFYPSGNSSASYVFNLKNNNLFEEIVFKEGYPY